MSASRAGADFRSVPWEFGTVGVCGKGRDNQERGFMHGHARMGLGRERESAVSGKACT